MLCLQQNLHLMGVGHGIFSGLSVFLSAMPLNLLIELPRERMRRHFESGPGNLLTLVLDLETVRLHLIDSLYTDQVRRYITRMYNTECSVYRLTGINDSSSCYQQSVCFLWMGQTVAFASLSPIDSKWFSHKFKGPGLLYEISISVSSGRIICAHGPFHCGSFSDFRILQNGLTQVLKDDENVIAEGGYIDENCTKNRDTEIISRYYAVIGERHETINRYLSNFLFNPIDFFTV